MNQSIVCMRAACQAWMERGFVYHSGPYQSVSPCPICQDVEHPGKMWVNFVGATCAFIVTRDCGHTFGWYCPRSAILDENCWKSPIYELKRTTSMEDESICIARANGFDGLTPNIYNPTHPWYQAYEQGRQDGRNQ